jgi:Phage tail tube protein, GTA-gp10
MSRAANAARGEAAVAGILLRPSFAALVAAEEELGPLFALLERAAAGQLKLSEMAALFWHCRFEAPIDLTREDFSEGVAACGLASATPALKMLLGQILGGTAYPPPAGGRG